MKVKVKLNTMDDCALFVAKCGQYEEDIDYCCNKYIVDACSLMGVMSVGLARVCEVYLHTNDADVANRFKEDMKIWSVE